MLSHKLSSCLPLGLNVAQSRGWIVSEESFPVTPRAQPLAGRPLEVWDLGARDTWASRDNELAPSRLQGPEGVTGDPLWGWR